jgi:hypothetical protein
MPRVSVLMPVRNDQTLVGAAIHGLAQQTLSDFELIVIDDGSTDRTCDIVREWAARDVRVKLVRLSRRLGLGAAINFGMGACRSRIVAYAPADAISDPRRLERQAAWLAERPFTALVGAGARVVDGRGRLIRTLRPHSGYEEIRSALRSPDAVIASSMTWRRRDIEAVGMLATDADVAGAELYELAVRVAARYCVENIPEALCVVRQDPPRQGQGEAAARAIRQVGRLAQQLLGGAPPFEGAPLPAPAPALPGPSASRPRRGSKIFVAVASYRDDELAPTLSDLFGRASHPDDITAGVCLQYDPAVDDVRVETGAEYADQVTMVHAHARESLGLGWARHTTERLWRGEAYVLQIDSHMRFADAWDQRLLEQLDRCDSAFPVLTTYPCRYVPPRVLRETTPPRLGASHFTDQGILRLSATADGPAPLRPTPQAFLAGGFAFYPGAMLREVPSDPWMYFSATEPTHSVRAWTHGWDFFAPSENLVYHLYSVDTAHKPAHWHDRADWNTLANRGQTRALHLLGTEQTFDLDALRAIEAYGLGHIRTIEDYQGFAGVDFRSRHVSDQARAARVNPRYLQPRRK